MPPHCRQLPMYLDAVDDLSTMLWQAAMKARGRRGGGNSCTIPLAATARWRLRRLWIGRWLASHQQSMGGSFFEWRLASDDDKEPTSDDSLLPAYLFGTRDERDQRAYTRSTKVTKTVKRMKMREDLPGETRRRRRQRRRSSTTTRKRRTWLLQQPSINASPPPYLRGNVGRANPQEYPSPEIPILVSNLRVGRWLQSYQRLRERSVLSGEKVIHTTNNS